MEKVRPIWSKMTVLSYLLNFSSLVSLWECQTLFLASNIILSSPSINIRSQSHQFIERQELSSTISRRKPITTRVPRNGFLRLWSILDDFPFWRVSLYSRRINSDLSQNGRAFALRINIRPSIFRSSRNSSKFNAEIFHSRKNNSNKLALKKIICGNIGNTKGILKFSRSFTTWSKSTISVYASLKNLKLHDLNLYFNLKYIIGFSHPSGFLNWSPK